MKYISALALLGLLFSFSRTERPAGVTSGSEPEVTLRVCFEGFEQKGNILVMLKNEREQKVDSAVIEAKGTKVCYAFNGLASGSYAASAFHDLNTNNKPDKNMFGAPAEPYGFSNNVRSTFGPPDFKKQLVKVTDEKEIFIELR